MKRLLAIILSVTLVFACFIPVSATEAEVYGGPERLIAEPLYEDIEPANVVTTYENGRIITVTTYILEDGSIVTDTFDRRANMLRSYEGSDNVTRRVDENYGSISLTASFKWWTSSGNPGAVGSWQSVECTSSSATYTPTESSKVSNKTKTTSDGPIKAGTAWAKASAFFYSKEFGSLYSDTYDIKIICTDKGDLSDK